MVSVPPYKGQAKKNTFYPFSEPVIPEKQEILDCFAHTAESVQGQIRRELKSGENFLSVFQPRNDQKARQCAPKQPGIAGRETRGWGCGAFGEYFAVVWKWGANVLPCAVLDSVPKPILKKIYSLLELNIHLFPALLGLHS